MNKDLQILRQEYKDQLVSLYNLRKYLTLVEKAQPLTYE